MNGQLSSAKVSNNMSSQPVIRSNRTNSKWRRYLPSVRSSIIFIYFLTSLLMNGGLEPKKRGFFCNDDTIQYPVMKDTVSFGKLVVIAMIIPWIVIKLLEKKLHILIDKSRSRPRSRSVQGYVGSSPRSRAEEEGLMGSNEQVKRRLVVNDGGDTSDSDSDSQDMDAQICDRVGGDEVTLKQDDSGKVEFKMSSGRVDTKDRMSDVQIFHLGLSTCAFFTGIGKMAGGRYRPHFMQQCQPDVECSMPANIHRYIVDFKCTNELMGPRDFSYITTSWPSGHASMIFYSMLYLIYYINTVIQAINHLRSNSRVRSKLSPLFVSSIYVLMVCLATYVSITRVSDYHHHPTDVLSGVVLGIVVAYAFAGHVFRPKIHSILPVFR